MGEMKYTKSQTEVIEAPTGNLLVSAAAGSGKTKVLTERILRKMTREVDPVSIENTLIVTFTRNAAAEMRTRIEGAIEDALAKEPDNERLIQQSRSIHFAKISTIDSFCQSVVRRYFHRIDIDPRFRLMDGAESEQMRNRVIGEVLEEGFASGNTAFRELVRWYGGKAGDGKLAEMVLSLAEKSDSHPFPSEWLNEKFAMFAEATDRYGNPYTDALVTDARRRIEGMIDVASRILARLSEPGMPAQYKPAFESDLTYLNGLLQVTGTQALIAELAQPEWAKLSTKKDPEGVDKAKKERIKDSRNEYKDTIKKVYRNLLACSGILFDMQRDCTDVLRALCDLTERFRERYMAEQKEQKAFTFSAISHLALSILVDENHQPTEAARQMSEEFEEIMIDEYQDSNLMQEFILGAVSRDVGGRPNLFMVGDVKQSIYKFRQAKPELFIDKCDRFAEDPASGHRIDLQKNFRSREDVLSAVNEVFDVCMRREVGGVDYDEKARLHYGNIYDEYDAPADPTVYRSEFLIAESENDTVGAEVEAIVTRVRELTDPQTGLIVHDRDEKQGHIAQYRDIVILTRSRGELHKALQRRFRQAGIPAYAASMDGYFDTIEVNTVVSMLRVLVNPFQEIPLATVLTCPVIGFSADDLARLALIAKKRRSGRKMPYTATVIREIAQDGERAIADNGSVVTKELVDRCSDWMRIYNSLRRHSAYLTTAELIEEFLNRTGFYQYCCALPDSEIRRKNLRMLIVKARRFAEANTGNISEFIDYIDTVRKYELSIEDELGAGVPNAVCLMTIHASKGMEFPIVFVSDTAKKFNMSDFNENLLLHDDLGIGPNFVVPEQKAKYATTAKLAIRGRCMNELVGEELRLLYVAMTRAKEKLIVTGRVRSKDRLSYGISKTFRVTGSVSYEDLQKSTLSYQTLVLMSILSYAPDDALEDILSFEAARKETKRSYASWDMMLTFPTRQESVKTTPEDECVPVADEEDLREKFLAELREYRDFRYSYQRSEIPTKVSVSFLKKQAYLEKETEKDAFERGDTVFYGSRSDLPQAPKPGFAGTKEDTKDENSGAGYGTAVHRFLQLHDYDLPNNEDAIAAEIAVMCEKRQLAPEEAAMIKPARISDFLSSEIGIRMKAAFDRGELERERNFVMQIRADAVDPAFPGEEKVLLQGIIDAYFPENGQIVLVDYKTDRVDVKDGERVLLNRYEKQLQLYAEAIERGTGKSVKECAIYSFALNKTVSVVYNDQDSV